MSLTYMVDLIFLTYLLFNLENRVDVFGERKNIIHIDDIDNDVSVGFVSVEDCFVILTDTKFDRYKEFRYVVIP